MKVLKSQTSLEFIIIVIAIIIVSVLVFYFYISTVSNNKVPSLITIANFQITGFSSNEIVCGFNFSFQSTSNKFNPFPLILQAQTYEGNQFNITITESNYTVSSYHLPTNNYQFLYNYTEETSNSLVCGIFTQYQESTTGEITGIFFVVNGKKELFEFSNPIFAVANQ